MRIARIWEMPNKYTFKMKAVSALLSREMDGEFADPFCGLYSPASYRNDADEANEADCHMDGLDFLKQIADESLDGVLFDPPYSVEQALRKYKPKQNGTAGRAEYWARCKDEIARVVKDGGKAICFGWDSTGIGKTRGFYLNEVLLICHGACHNDTIITVEKKRAKILKYRRVPMNKTINCDQVMWMQNALTRYAQHHHAAMSFMPAVARPYADTAQVACIIELMEVLGLQVADKLAEGNILAGIRALIPQDKASVSTGGKSE